MHRKVSRHLTLLQENAIIISLVDGWPLYYIVCSLIEVGGWHLQCEHSILLVVEGLRIGEER